MFLFFFDCTWASASGLPGDSPLSFPNEQPAVWPNDDMMRVCIARHGLAIDMLFLDFSIRKVGLKELWYLKWNQGYDVQSVISSPPNWPDWMKNAKGER